MTFALETLIPILLGAVIFAGYSLFLLIRWNFRKRDHGVDLSKRINKILEKPETTELEASLSLIKQKAPSETFFKSKLPRIEGYREWLQHAGIEMSPVIFALVSVVLGLGVGLTFFILFKTSLFFSVLMWISSSYLLPWAIVIYLTRRRKNKFLDSFPNALDMVRRALRSGHSAERALEMVAEQVHGPVGEAFHMITDKMRLGESVENVLREMANRIGVEEFRMLSIVLVLQRETGGSLAEATENFAKIIRARQNLRKKIKALTAEGRMSALILTAIPFFILGAVYATTPNYLDPLFYNPTGQMLLTIGGLMITFGIIIILRMVYKEIY
jgi:tight adherence protein B